MFGQIKSVEVGKKLERLGNVAEVEKEKSRSFDIAFAEERAYLIKVVGNIESVSSEQAEALKKSASVVDAKPVVLSESVKEGVIYRRHGIPVMKSKTFLQIVRGKNVAVADRGCVKVPVKGVKKHREKKGLSRGALARLVGVSKEMIRRYEEGEAHPSKEVAEKMVEILGKGIVARYEFKSTKVKKAFIGKGPFEIGIRKRKPILVSLRDDDVRIRNLENVGEVLKAKTVFAKDKNVDEII